MVTMSLIALPVTVHLGRTGMYRSDVRGAQARFGCSCGRACARARRAHM